MSLREIGDLLFGFPIDVVSNSHRDKLVRIEAGTVRMIRTVRTDTVMLKSASFSAGEVTNLLGHFETRILSIHLEATEVLGSAEARPHLVRSGSDWLEGGQPTRTVGKDTVICLLPFLRPPATRIFLDFARLGEFSL